MLMKLESMIICMAIFLMQRGRLFSFVSFKIQLARWWQDLIVPICLLCEKIFGQYWLHLLMLFGASLFHIFLSWTNVGWSPWMWRFLYTVLSWFSFCIIIGIWTDVLLNFPLYFLMTVYAIYVLMLIISRSFVVSRHFFSFWWGKSVETWESYYNYYHLLVHGWRIEHGG